MPTPPPPPQLQAVANPDPAPNAAAAVTIAPVPLPSIAAPVAITETTAVAPPAATAPPKIELPSSDAEYLQNPKPAYPPISKRLNEQGTVGLRVLIGIDGSARKAEVTKSSGFRNLDQVALDTVLKWRYVPGKRGGIPEEMWVPTSLVFKLE